METWAIVVLVVGTNLGTALLALLGIKKQLKYSDRRFAKELEAKREADEHNRKWLVGSEPLLRLREELAVMAQRFEDVVDFSTQVARAGSTATKKKREDLIKAVDEWDRYSYSGKFYQAIHMQYNYELKREANQVYIDYALAYNGIRPFLESGGGQEKIEDAKNVIGKNAINISELQSKINELLEEL